MPVRKDQWEESHLLDPLFPEEGLLLTLGSFKFFRFQNSFVSNRHSEAYQIMVYFCICHIWVSIQAVTKTTLKFIRIEVVRR